MTDLLGSGRPAGVLEFLDVHGLRWNPTLMLVMGGALGLVSPVMLGAVLPPPGLCLVLLQPPATTSSVENR